MKMRAEVVAHPGSNTWESMHRAVQSPPVGTRTRFDSVALGETGCHVPSGPVIPNRFGGTKEGGVGLGVLGSNIVPHPNTIGGERQGNPGRRQLDGGFFGLVERDRSICSLPMNNEIKDGVLEERCPDKHVHKKHIKHT